MSTYAPPIDALLTLGDDDPLGVNEWPDYVSTFGLTLAHVPDLLRMASEDRLYKMWGSAESWAPIHARRALGQLRAVVAVAPLLEAMDEFLDDDDFWAEETPKILAMIGPGGMPAIVARLSEQKPDAFTRLTCAAGLKAIAADFPEARPEIVEALTRQLALGEDDHDGWIVNAGIVDALTDLKAVESAGVIEAAFQADVVDESYAGGWASARYRLGLGRKPGGNDIRPQWRVFYAPPKPKRPDPKVLLKRRARKTRMIPRRALRTLVLVSMRYTSMRARAIVDFWMPGGLQSPDWRLEIGDWRSVENRVSEPWGWQWFPLSDHESRISDVPIPTLQSSFPGCCVA